MNNPIRCLAAPLLLTLAATLAFAQSPSIPRPGFEIASVRLSPLDAPGTVFSPSGSLTFNATDVSLLGLIGLAFGVGDAQVVGLPKWSETTRYEVVAKPQGEKPLNDLQLQEALQQLLAQRFHLPAHHETKLTSGYHLVAQKARPNCNQAREAANPVCPLGQRSAGAEHHAAEIRLVVALRPERLARR